jgi:hypothetical protein
MKNPSIAVARRTDIRATVSLPNWPHSPLSI